MEVKFNRTTNFLGRNGIANCIGILITKYLGSNHINITPVTSKNKAGRCWITIPQENVGAICGVLQKDLLSLVLNNIDQKELPILLGLDSTLDEYISKQLKKHPRNPVDKSGKLKREKK